MKREELLHQLCDLIRNTGGEYEIKNDYIIMKSCDFRNMSFGSTIKFMEKVVFVDCEFVNTSFANMILNLCTFIECDLTGGTFLHCSLSNITFLKTNGQGTHFRDNSMDDVCFNDVSMDGLRISLNEDYAYDTFIYITSSVIKNMHLEGIDSDAVIRIKYSHLCDAEIVDSCIGNRFDVCGAHMKRLYISGTNIHSSVIRDSDLSDSCIKSEYISPMCTNVNFSGSEFRSRDMDGARFVNCNMSKVEFDCSDVINSTFKNCALVDTNMSDKYRMRNLEFISSKFIGTNMSDLKFSDCEFSDCFMQDVHLANTKFNRITESEPNYIEWFTISDTNNVEWDGIDIANMDYSESHSTLKQAIIKAMNTKKEVKVSDVGINKTV